VKRKEAGKSNRTVLAKKKSLLVDRDDSNRGGLPGKGKRKEGKNSKLTKRGKERKAGKNIPVLRLKRYHEGEAFSYMKYLG